LGTQPDSQQWIESVPTWSWALFAIAGGIMLRGSR
jgi:ubiquinone biosynthesis protein